MNNFAYLVQKMVRLELEKQYAPGFGIVTSVHPHSAPDDKENYACSVRLRDSDLELRQVPVVSGHIGTVAIPNVGDLVLLNFVDGDLNRAVVVGRLYNDKDRPPVNKASEIIHRLYPDNISDEERADNEDQALKIDLRNLSDNDPPRELEISLPEKVTVRIVDHTVALMVGQVAVELRQEGDSDGVIQCHAGKSLITVNQDGDIAIASEGAVELTAKGDMSLSAPNVEIKTDQSLTLDAGTEATFKSGTQATIESGAAMEIKSSATAKVEASADLALKGATVNIN